MIYARNFSRLKNIIYVEFETSNGYTNDIDLMSPNHGKIKEKLANMEIIDL